MERFAPNDPTHDFSHGLIGEQTIGKMRAAGFRALGPMADKAQIFVDRAVLNVGLQRLTITKDIMAAGLTINLPDPLSWTVYEWESMGKVGGAQRTMSPQARGENQLPDRVLGHVPIYCTTDDFNLDIRTLKASQRMGAPLDMTLAEQATRRVNEAIEDSVINGAGLTVGGYTAPGILNAPNANTQVITAAAWNGTTPNGATVVGETMSMIGKLQADFKYGPYAMYVGTNMANGLGLDYSTLNAQGLTIRQRVLAIDSITSIKVADMLPANTVVLMQLTSDVIQIINGQAPTVVPWTSLDGFRLFWLVLALVVPLVRSDASGNSGIVIGS